jgi:predicted transcriptional regulator
MKTNETKEYIILNTPKDLNLQQIFPTFQENILKVEFLINQINQFSKKEDIGYTLNIKNHNWFFSNDHITRKILKVLIENKIIYCSSNFVKGQNSKAYKMVKTFKADESSNQTFFFIDDRDLTNPKFINKYIIDGFRVKNAEATAYLIKPVQIKEESNDALKQEVKRLQEANEALEAKIEELTNQNEEIIENDLVLQAEAIITGTTINNLVSLVSMPESIQLDVTVDSLQQITKALQDVFDVPIINGNKLIFTEFQLILQNNYITYISSSNDPLLKNLVENQIDKCKY